jgi:hypothetical protein
MQLFEHHTSSTGLKSFMQKIVSGGQTGVDRGALDAALELAFPCGGWCPTDRMAEDGRIDDRYPVVELSGAGYRQRTRQNVIDSDGTLVIYNGELSGGTRETVRFCERLGKPFVALDALTVDEAAMVKQALAFVAEHGVAVLNVAGPRASSWVDGHAVTQRVVRAIISGR